MALFDENAYIKTMKIAAIILAAGQGTRLKSALPKPLHRVGGRPMLAWSLDAANSKSGFWSKNEICRISEVSIAVVQMLSKFSRSQYFKVLSVDPHARVCV